MRKKVLFIVSSANSIGPKNRKTGNFLPEVAHPYVTFIKNNYQVDIASIKGGSAPVDGLDLRDDEMNVQFLDGDGLKKMQTTRKLEDVNVAEYDAIFMPGGLGPMADMPQDIHLQQVVKETFERGAVVGAVCHGPAAFVNVKLSDGTYLIQDRNITSFSNAEEEGYAKDDVPFMLESALKERGAKFTAAAPWQKNVIADGKLITGQNPASATGVAESMIEALEKQ